MNPTSDGFELSEVCKLVNLVYVCDIPNICLFAAYVTSKIQQDMFIYTTAVSHTAPIARTRKETVCTHCTSLSYRQSSSISQWWHQLLVSQSRIQTEPEITEYMTRSPPPLHPVSGLTRRAGAEPRCSWAEDDAPWRVGWLKRLNAAEGLNESQAGREGTTHSDRSPSGSVKHWMRGLKIDPEAFPVLLLLYHPCYPHSNLTASSALTDEYHRRVQRSLLVQ